MHRHGISGGALQHAACAKRHACGSAAEVRLCPPAACTRLLSLRIELQPKETSSEPRATAGEQMRLHIFEPRYRLLVRC